MHKSTSILDFFKKNSRPPSGGSFTAYGLLLLATLHCYAKLLEVVADCEFECNGTRGGGSYLA